MLHDALITNACADLASALFQGMMATLMKVQGMTPKHVGENSMRRDSRALGRGRGAGRDRRYMKRTRGRRVLGFRERTRDRGRQEEEAGQGA